jgi:hypothetical protein
MCGHTSLSCSQAAFACRLSFGLVLDFAFASDAIHWVLLALPHSLAHLLSLRSPTGVQGSGIQDLPGKMNLSRLQPWTHETQLYKPESE